MKDKKITTYRTLIHSLSGYAERDNNQEFGYELRFFINKNIGEDEKITLANKLKIEVDNAMKRYINIVNKSSIEDDITFQVTISPLEE